MSKLTVLAAVAAMPMIAAAQSQLGNGMGTQSSAAPPSDMANDPSNAGKTQSSCSGSKFISA